MVFSIDGYEDINIPHVLDETSVPIGIAQIILDYFGFYHTMDNLQEQSEIRNYRRYDLELVIDCKECWPYKVIQTAKLFNNLTCAWDLSPCMQESVPEESLN